MDKIWYRLGHNSGKTTFKCLINLIILTKTGGDNIKKKIALICAMAMVMSAIPVFADDNVTSNVTSNTTVTNNTTSSTTVTNCTPGTNCSLNKNSQNCQCNLQKKTKAQHKFGKQNKKNSKIRHTCVGS